MSIRLWDSGKFSKNSDRESICALLSKDSAKPNEKFRSPSMIFSLQGGGGEQIPPKPFLVMTRPVDVKEPEIGLQGR